MSYKLKNGEEIRDGILYGWTGKSCPACQGSGEENESRSRCNQCAGTGEAWGKIPIQPINLENKILKLKLP